jgi:hypothetical protein
MQAEKLEDNKRGDRLMFEAQQLSKALAESEREREVSLFFCVHLLKCVEASART